MEVFVLTENGDLVGVFSTRDRLTEYIGANPVKPVFCQSADGITVEEMECRYRTQRVLLDQVLTDA